MGLPIHLNGLYTKLKDLLHVLDTPEIEARMIIEQRTNYDFGDLIATPQAIVDEEALTLIRADVQERLEGKPLSKIYGQKEFYGLAFKVNEETLDPRPDTETLIEAVLERIKTPPERILDLGTGTGCILITLLKHFPLADAVGVDLSQEALVIAQENAQMHGYESQTSFLHGSWFDPVEGQFDLIVSNPPYIANQVIPTLSKEVQNHDPILALDGGEDGLQAYRDIFSKVFLYLKPGGKAFFEIGFDQESKVVRLAEESGLSVVGKYRDLAGQPRVVEISGGDK